MKYKAKISLPAKEWEDGLDEELSLEDMNKYLDEYLSNEDLDEDLLTDDFEEIDRKVEHFTEQITELEAELKRLNRQAAFSVSDSCGGLSSKREEIEYKMDVLDERRSILRGYKEALEGKGVSNEIVFANLERKLEAMR
jgi:DNA-binding transcriptional MerR regulator